MRLALLVLVSGCFIAPDRPGNNSIVDAPPTDIYNGPCTEVPDGVTLPVAVTMPRPGGTGLVRAGRTTTDQPVLYFFEPRSGFSSTCATQSHTFSDGPAFEIVAVAPHDNDILVLGVMNAKYEVRQLQFAGGTLVELPGKITSMLTPSTIPYGTGTGDSGNASSPFIAAKLGFVYFGGPDLRVGTLPIGGVTEAIVPVFAGDAPQPGQAFYNAAPLVNHGVRDFVMVTPNNNFTVRGVANIIFTRLATNACSAGTTPNQCEGRVARAIYDLAPTAPRLAGAATTRSGYVEAYFDETDLYVGVLLGDLSVGPRRALDVAIDELTEDGGSGRFEVVLVTQSTVRSLEIWRGAIGRTMNGGGAPSTTVGLADIHTRVVTGQFDTMNRRIYVLSERPRNAGADDFCANAMLQPCN